MGQRALLRRRSAWALVIAPVLAVTGVYMAATSQAATVHPARTAAVVHQVRPNRVNNVDCNGYSTKYKALRAGSKMQCTDPISIKKVRYYGKSELRGYRFKDNGHYIGHDEPSVKFESKAAKSGNTMTYFMKLPVDPKKAATANGSVTHYVELSPAPWFGLPMCDPHSYPQNACTPDSDSNIGSISSSKAAGSAFMELQLYPPGMTPFEDNVSCSSTRWCAAVTIDSLESAFGFKGLNTACEEPVNFAFLQRNGVPAGPPSPQLADVASDTPNAQTLEMNPGDVLKVSITDPAAGFTTKISDLTTGQTGFMVASSGNGFMDTNYKTCAGIAHTFHAEYATASQKNQVPWAALEGGVLMQQETGHFESCNSVKNALPQSLDGGNYVDKNVFQTCEGGVNGPKSTGEGPCSTSTGLCQHAMTEGAKGPVACSTNNAGSGKLCEFSNADCFNKGTRTTTVNGKSVKQTTIVTGCEDNFFQNGDLDWDGNDYKANSWPNGSANSPTSIRYVGPFDAAGNPYPQIQFETDAPGSEALCNTTTGKDCVVTPLGSDFYPFWTLTSKQTLNGVKTPKAACVWNFGNVNPGVTKLNFGKDAQYGLSDIARYGGTDASKVLTNPAISGNCPSFKQPKK